MYSEMYWCISVEEAKAPGRPGAPGGPGGPGGPEVTEEEYSQAIRDVQWKFSALKYSCLNSIPLEEEEIPGTPGSPEKKIQNLIIHNYN